MVADHQLEKFPAALESNKEAFVVYKASLKLKFIIIHLAQKAQITLLPTKKVTVPAEYSDFINIFLGKLFEVLLK